MRKLRSILLATSLSLCSLAALGAASAGAAPVWDLTMHHAQTNFPPGGQGEYWFAIENVGPDPTSGTIKLTVDLPAGITRNYTIFGEPESLVNPSWSCPGSPGDSTVVCTTTGSIPRHSVYFGLRLGVDIAPSVTGEPQASATVEGGGAAKAAADTEPVTIDSQPAGFGIPAASLLPGFFEADATTPVREAGAHPALVTFPFDFNTVPTGKGVEAQVENPEAARDIHLDLPPGFIGAPTAVTECSAAQFASYACPASSQVGRLDLLSFPITSTQETVFHQFHVAVFNLAHPRGVASDLAFAIAGNPVNVHVSLDPSNHYAITSAVPDINETISVFAQRLTVWGCRPAPATTRSAAANSTATAATPPKNAPPAPPKSPSSRSPPSAKPRTSTACTATTPGSTTASSAPRSTTPCRAR
jgi:hypothetical protein